MLAVNKPKVVSRNLLVLAVLLGVVTALIAITIVTVLIRN